jgi:hypothetical protein
MATSAERIRALRERARRGIRRLTVDVSEGDLQAMVERGYEGAASTDHDRQAQAAACSSPIAFSKYGRPVPCHSPPQKLARGSRLAG